MPKIRTNRMKIGEDSIEFTNFFILFLEKYSYQLETELRYRFLTSQFLWVYFPFWLRSIVIVIQFLNSFYGFSNIYSKCQMKTSFEFNPKRQFISQSTFFRHISLFLSLKFWIKLVKKNTPLIFVRKVQIGRR